MAAELTYRTIFSLIPVVVLGLVMFRVVGGLTEVQSTVEYQLYSFFGVPEITAGYSNPIPAESTEDESESAEDESNEDESNEVESDDSEVDGVVGGVRFLF